MPSTLNILVNWDQDASENRPSYVLCTVNRVYITCCILHTICYVLYTILCTAYYTLYTSYYILYLTHYILYTKRFPIKAPSRLVPRPRAFSASCNGPASRPKSSWRPEVQWRRSPRPSKLGVSKSEVSFQSTQNHGPLWKKGDCGPLFWVCWRSMLGSLLRRVATLQIGSVDHG